MLKTQAKTQYKYIFGKAGIIMSKTLIAYFSTGGTTARLAADLAKALEADLYEIQPQEPYTEKDLNWVNPLSRSTKEYISKKEPEIKGAVENMGQYDTVIIGAPIWFFKVPNIVNRFLKQYDFTGKKMGLFVTSHKAGVEKAADAVKEICPKAIWGKGVLANNMTISDLTAWAGKIAD